MKVLLCSEGELTFPLHNNRTKLVGEFKSLLAAGEHDRYAARVFEKTWSKHLLLLFMQAEELEDLIRQHGEAARLYEHEAVQIGKTYIIQNFGFDESMQTSLDELLEHRRFENYGLVDVRVFAIPEDFTLFPNEGITEVEEGENAAIDDL